MNRTILSVLFVMLLCVLAVGFYRGWFALSSPHHDLESHKVDVNLTLDRDKMREDAEVVKNKTAELSGKVTAPAKEISNQPPIR